MSLLEFKTLIDHKVFTIDYRPQVICTNLVQSIIPNHFIKGENCPPIAPAKMSPGNTSIMRLGKDQKDLYQTWWSRSSSETFPTYSSIGLCVLQKVKILK